MDRITSNQRLLELAKFMEQRVPPNKFEMASYYTGNFKDLEGMLHGCGTSACIAGWTALAFPEEIELVDPHAWTEVIYNGEPYDIQDAAQEHLGLTDDEGDNLFFDQSIKTPQQAADALRALADNREKE